MEVRRLDSTDANVSKYVFDFPGAVAESVLYRYGNFEERTVVCCSTQSGCPVGCRFCGAGDAFVRSLTAEEIVAQPEYLFAERGIDTEKVKSLQIMFMSMGEPFLNWPNLAKAIERLHALHPNAALLVSTSAPRVNYESFHSLSSKISKVGLQFSVHESSDVARNKLIPFKHKLTLSEIAEEGEKWHCATGRQPFFNYCVHEGNVSDEDAERLVNLFNPNIWQATISVICERNESVSAANIRQRKFATDFRVKLGKLGFETRIFDPAGQDDIGGGCGQLWFVQEWMRKHPEIVHKSAGSTLPIIHTPS